MGTVRNWNPREDAIRSTPYPDEIEWLSLEQYNNKVHLAHWYMRRAGMSPFEKGMVTPQSTGMEMGRIFFVSAGLVLVTLFVLSIISRMTS